jgi:type IV secretion system protein VirB9
MNKSVIKRSSLALFLGLLASIAMGAERYNELQDAAVAQARIWQQGGKAKPMMSSDGMVIFPFGQTMPKLTCSPSRACDVEMQIGEKVKKVILGDGVNWTWDSAVSGQQGQQIQHVVFQPRDMDLESNVIITTDRRTYHIKLYAPKKESVYLNRIGFYYPQELVSSWESKAGEESREVVKEEGRNVLAASVPVDRLDFDYRVEGDADFKPVRVMNDGERVYIEMPESLRTDRSPILMTLDAKDEAMVVNFRRLEDPVSKKVHYVVDKLFAKAELRDGNEKVRITWNKKSKSFWSGNWSSRSFD